MIPRQRSESCLSDAKLDQLLAADLSAAAEHAARAHLASCSVCEQRHRELALDRAEFAARAPAFETISGRGPASAPASRSPRVAREPGSRRWLRQLALPAAALLALGIGLRSVLRDGQPGERAASAPPEVTRTKGSGVSFGFVVRREGHNFVGEPGQQLQPGDVLRFTLSSAAPVFAGVWGVDASERWSSYQTSPLLAPLGAGQRQLLPEAVELDQSLGQERLVAVVCSAQHVVAEIDAALAAAPGASALPADCQSESLSIVKASR